MNKDRVSQIINEVYDKYLTKYVGYDDVPSKELFLFEIKNNTEFSEKWGLKIDERELIAQERLEWVKTNLSNVEVGGFISNDEYSHKWVETLANNIPTKLITLTYNNKTIESYEKNII